MDKIVIPSNERIFTDEMVFSAFDLDYPGLEMVREAYMANDMAKAKRELVEYLRTRSNVTHFFDFRTRTTPIGRDILPYYFQASLGLDENISDFALYAGRQMMENRYVSPGARKVTWDFGKDFSNEIHFNQERDGKRMHRSVFSIFTRGQFLEYLMFLYHETNDMKVVDKYSEVLDFFFRTYPIIVEDESPSAGHLMTTEDRDVMDMGWLCFVYVEMLYTKMSYELQPDQTFEIMRHLLFCALQFRRFDNDVYRPYNHHYFERGITPLFLSLMFPEIPALEEMKERAAEICRRHIKVDFSAKGGYSEQSIAYWYGAAVAEMLFRNAASARLNGFDLLDEDSKKRINGTFQIMENLMISGERLPDIGDNRAPLVEPLLELAYQVTGNEHYRNLLSERKKGVYKIDDIVRHTADEEIGFAIGKSGISDKANGFIMSAKVNSGISGHNHMDMLSLITILRGKHFISEPYSGKLYHIHTHGSHLRGWCYNMESHNSVLCYGEPVASWDKYANRFGVYRPDTHITCFKDFGSGMYVSGYHYGYTFCSHERRVLFADNGNMMVRDIVDRGNRMDPPHIQRWHLDPGVEVRRISENTLLLENDGVSSLWLFDHPEEMNIYKDTELLGNYFTPDELGYVIDVSFRSREMDTDRAMLSNLSLMMIDVTGRQLPDEAILLKKMENIRDKMESMAALEELASL